MVGLDWDQIPSDPGGTDDVAIPLIVVRSSSKPPVRIDFLVLALKWSCLVAVQSLGSALQLVISNVNTTPGSFSSPTPIWHFNDDDAYRAFFFFSLSSPSLAFSLSSAPKG